MTIKRSQMLLRLAMGILIVSGLGIGSASADKGPVPVAGQDHDAMKAEKKISVAMARLSPADRKQAESQRYCPMMAYTRLGAMGTPVKVMIEGESVFVCCKGCIDEAKKGGEVTVKTAQKLMDSTAVLSKMPPKERAAIEAQKYCAVQSRNLLGTMGEPIKLELNGKPAYLCCKGCTAKAEADPAATLVKVEELKKAGLGESHDHADHEHGDVKGNHKH